MSRRIDQRAEVAVGLDGQGPLMVADLASRLWVVLFLFPLRDVSQEYK